MKEAVLITNAHSRNGAEVTAKARELLPQRGISIVEALTAPNGKALLKMVKRAVKSGRRLIVVIGGDGSQTSAVRALAHTKAVLGVLPAGTGNSFALSLGIHSVDEALEAIVSGREARVDLGIANGTYFANFATIGLPSVAADETPRGLKKLLGPIAYGIAGINALRSDPAFRLRVKWKKNRLEFQAHQAIVASGRYYGHEPLVPDARIDDGLLAFFATAAQGQMDIVRTNAALVRGDQTSLPNAQYFQSPAIELDCKPRQLVSVDGKALTKTPVRFEIAHAALRVFVPQAAGDDE